MEEEINIEKQLKSIAFQINCIADQQEFEKFYEKLIPERKSKFNIIECLKEISNKINNLIESCTATKN